MPDQLRIQVFKPLPPPTYYTLDELAQRWGMAKTTVMKYLSQMRHSHHRPTGDQVTRWGRNCAVRTVRIRSDYAELMRAIFRERRIRL